MNYQEHMNQAPNLHLARKLSIAAWIVSALVLGLVAMMRQIKLPLP